ncbi:MAG TPA: flagellar export chaperone FliS [Noviherbaspirillum sp.]|nr:flagellar export chaperone FliS [Noviherbaspirillum sp.]
MFGSSMSGASAYSKVGMETGVVAASPHKLIVMLFEGAMLSITAAQKHMQAGETEAKGRAIGKAVSIIEEGLRASLDKKVGGEIALSLDSLYEYMVARLTIANLKNQPAILEEVHQLLKGLKDAWEAIDPARAAQSVQPAPAPAAKAYDPLAPTQSRLVKA